MIVRKLDRAWRHTQVKRIHHEGHKVHEGRALDKRLEELSIRNIRNLRVLRDLL